MAATLSHKLVSLAEAADVLLRGQRRAQKRPRRVMAAPLDREAANCERCIVAALERRKAPELAFPQFRGLFTTLPRLDSNQQPAG